jgi:hypothetical protein
MSEPRGYEHITGTPYIDDTALMVDSIETLQAFLHEVVISHCVDCTNEGLHLRDTLISHHLHHFRGLLARPPTFHVFIMLNKREFPIESIGHGKQKNLLQVNEKTQCHMKT